MTVLRSWADVEAFEGGPTEAEMQVIEASQAGEQCILGDGLRPTKDDPDRTVRAEILRYLLLGGTEDRRVHESGVWLAGGNIVGVLDLDFLSIAGGLSLQACRFDAIIRSASGTLVEVDLSDSELVGWNAANAIISGSVNLNGCISTGEVALFGAQIGGTLFAAGARLRGPFGTALSAHGAQVSGSVVLGAEQGDDTENGLAPLVADGTVVFNGAQVGGFFAEGVTIKAPPKGNALSLNVLTSSYHVVLNGLHATGEVKLEGARIAGRLGLEKARLGNDKGHAFNGQRMQVEQSFVWKKVTVDTGAVSLNGAHVTELDDDPQNWPGADSLYLDGFTFDRIRGRVSTSRDRMAWLRDGSYFDGEFRPQPYTHYAKFLRDTGHDEDARAVLTERERLRRRSARRQRIADGDSFALPVNAWLWIWDLLLRLVVGYGHRPFNSVIALALLITLAILPAHFAWEEGSFAPNASPIQISEGWIAALSAENPARAWSAKGAAGQDWETFNRYAYGVDVVIPIINFGQTEAWAPSTHRGPWGWHLWWARWVLTSLGWIVTALGAAAITGIIRRE